MSVPRIARGVAPAMLLLALAGCHPQSALRHEAGPPTTPTLATPETGRAAAGRRFAIAVIPDTQYLFDQDRGNPEVLAASLRWIAANARRRRIAFVAHLGDIVENARPDELARAVQTFEILDRAGIPYSAPAGNHDLRNSRADDAQRGPEPYLDAFPPARFSSHAGFGGASPSGYNTWHRFEAAGRSWLVLALDWRPSAASIAWARDVLQRHPELPAILTTHELVVDDTGNGVAALSPHGQRLWDELIAGHDAVFLAIGGHFWPPARTVRTNAAGHDVQLHLANYQNRYYGGSGMIRLYELDLDRGAVEVSTFSPWVLGQPEGRRNALARGEAELLDPANRFTLAIDFEERLPGRPRPPAVPAEQVVIPGTVAYWRFDNGRAGEPLPDHGTAVPDRSGQGNPLHRVTLANGSAGDLAWSAAFHRDQPSRQSLYFNGSRLDPPLRGAYLRTADDAPLNRLRFERGYTLEAFLRVPRDCCEDRHAWMGVISRSGSGGAAGKLEGDLQEPTATLSVSPGRQLQWAVFPADRPGPSTCWSHELPPHTWVHVAVVNDGHHTKMYVDGAEVLRNPAAENAGLATAGEPWLIGASHYGGAVKQSFYGWLGDVRIVARALAPEERMGPR